MKKFLTKRILPLLLVLTMLLGFAAPIGATQAQSTLQPLSIKETDDATGVQDADLTPENEVNTDEPAYAPEDIVRVSIVLDGKSTLEKGFSTRSIAVNREAMAYRQALRETQTQVTADIEQAIGEELDVKWSLTLAANIISANIPYGQIETIRNVSGVRDVVLETQYAPCVVDEELSVDPNMATSTVQTGSTIAWADGYTGAGSRIAVIDTGLDLDHQSFDPDAYLYSMELLAEDAGMSLDDYLKQVNVLTTEEIAAVLPELNVIGAAYSPNVTAEDLYQNSKVPFGYNYIDMTAGYIEHDYDAQGGHGSHVEGIAAANAYIANGDGTYTDALEVAHVKGVAPDAQIVVMKVFGQLGGAYESDYMAAIEDAIILGCDSINLSLGAGSPGFVTNNTYQELLDFLSQTDTVVTMSAGNSGNWADSATHNAPGYIYADDVSVYTGGSPGSYTNSMGVASVNNAGGFGLYFTANDVGVLYTETDYSNLPLSTLGGEHEYIFIDGIGTAEDFAALGDALEGKVAFCFRGTTSFFEKATNAVDHGAIATVVCNNQSGSINMDLTDYRYTEPCVSITLSEANAIRAASTPVTDDAGNVLYYTGKIFISSEMGAIVGTSEYYTISDFSSYGVPGDLSLKPEITAPGGNIYSVDGESRGGKSYTNMSGTSMAAPQMAGMAAVVAQYIKENGLDERTGLSVRALAQSLLMSTAVPMLQSEGQYYPVLRQGAGLANVGAAVQADSYILMDESSTDSWADGKVKAELGEDADRSGVYEITFTLNNLTDEARQYTLSTALFTQGVVTDGTWLYMDNGTVNMQAVAAWTVDGAAIEPAAQMPLFDFNGDKLVNVDDVQTLLDYAADNSVVLHNADLADLSGDGMITTYDAYLLLGELNSELVELPAGGSVEITVVLTLTEAQKAELNNDPNGAYIEGYVYVEGLATGEGVLGTSHSIPVLCYYGSWTDPSMYDQGTFISRLYGDTKPTYISAKAQNYLVLKRADNAESYIHTGNPYIVEETYPEGKITMNPEAELYQQYFATIRNAAGFTHVVLNEDNEVVYMFTPSGDVAGAYYHVNGGAWYNTARYSTIGLIPAEMGFEEGDTLTYALVAIPEYYEEGDRLTYQQVKDMINNGELGEGAYLKSTFKLDATAPVISNIYKDLQTGNILVKASDNNDVAIVQLQTLNGRVLAQVVPGEDGVATIDMSTIKVGTEAIVVVGDYAMNETAYVVELGGEPEDFSGQFYGFTLSNYRGTGKRWMQIIPEELWYYNTSNYSGTYDLQNVDITVHAAEYVDGYVFMAASDGYFYVAQHEFWMDATRAGYFGDKITRVRDMAFNYADKTMYVISDTNVLYSMDLTSTELTEVGTISLTNPYTSSANNKRIFGLAIDDNGRFYIMNYGGATQTFLYTFTLDDFVDGQITNLAPIANYRNGGAGYYFCAGCLAYDHDADVLYMAGGMFDTGWNNGYLATVDVTTGKATKVTQEDGDFGAKYASLLYATIFGLYIVPSGSAGLVEMTNEASGIALDKTEIRGLVGMETAIKPFVTNWNVRDKSVTWTTSDSSVATVTTAGRVKLVGVGEATITATTNAAPYLSTTCTVIVEERPAIDLTAMLQDADGNALWVDFNTTAPQDYEIVAESDTAFYSGDDLDGVIYVHDGTTMYGVDADTFSVTTYNNVSTSWRWSDAAAAPAIGSYCDYMLCLSVSGDRLAQIDVTTGVVDGSWDMTSTLGGDKMAAIAYAGTGKHDFGTMAYSVGKVSVLDTHFYYMVTESGDLWKVYMGVYEQKQFGERVQFEMVKLGNLGIDLSGVSKVVNGQYASLVYDQESGYVILSAYTGGSTNKLYAIQPESVLALEIGDFGTDIWPVVSLHQYDRATDLTLRMKTEEATIYEGNTTQLRVEVALAEKDETVTWTSSDTSIATVDANGKVTGVSAGTVTITATSVETNDQGQKVSATATVIVLPNKPMDLTVGAQIVTADGTPKWVTIDTGDGTYTVDGNATSTFAAAAGHDGMLVGVTADYDSDGKYYTIDVETFEETASHEITSAYGFRDITTAPASVMDICDYWSFEHFDYEAFGMPAAVLEDNRFVVLDDAFFTKQAGWQMDLWEIDNNCATLAYMGHTWYTPSVYEDLCEALVFYSVASDGRLREFVCRPQFDDYYYDPSLMGYSLSSWIIGNVGMTFDDPYGMTMTYIKDEKNNGLLLADTTDNKVDLYWIDLNSGNYQAVKICTLEGATSISGLYTQDDLDGTLHNSNLGNHFNSYVEKPYLCLTEDKFVGEVSCVIGEEREAAAEAVETEPVAPAAADVSDDCVADVNVVSLRADTETTNGLVVVEFDPALAALESFTAYTGMKSVKETDGKVTFAYVNETALAKDTVLADLVFTLLQDQDAEITITVLENCADRPNSSETVTLTVPGHSYELTETVAPTCTEDGYETWTCAACGDSYTVVLEAIGHDYESVVTAPTCTEGGYTTHTCTICGDSYITDKTAPVCPSAAFTDIYKSAWYHEAVDYVVEHGLMKGMSETVFAPEGKTTRAQLVTVLYRMAGAPETELTTQFKDVAADAWYAEAVAWAYANEITKGVTEDRFDPDAYVTREQMVTLLARYATLCGMDMETEGDLSAYTDAAQVSAYAVESMIWAVENGIITGMGDGTLKPAADSTRAQIATILMRFMEN